MPKFGGAAVILGFLIATIYLIITMSIEGTINLFNQDNYGIKLVGMLLAIIVLEIVCIRDDIKPIKATYKLLGHIAAASVIVFYGGILLNNITAFGFYFDFGIWAYLITILFLVACTNIINLIDGLDGLSGGICCIFYLTIGIIGFYQGRYGSLVMILTFIMLGSTLGFLLHNFNPAKIFAGDCATFMGFIIGVITLLEFKGPALISFFVPVTILGIPILDTLFAIIRRLLKGQPPFKADKQHLHHQLLGMNFSQKTTVLIIYGINLLFAAASIFYTIKDPIKGIIMYILILIIVIWFILHTTIISDKSPELTKKVKSKLKLKNHVKKSTK